MKKRVIAPAALTFLLAPIALLSGCHRIAGNHPGFKFLSFKETENGFTTRDYEVSVAEKTYRVLSSDEKGADSDYALSEDVVLYGGTAPRYVITAPTGFDGVVEYIEAQEIEGNDSSVVDTYGVVSDGVLTGFVNVYKDTIGYLSGGGNYGVEEIDHSITFTYNPGSDEFNVTNTIDGAMLVSFYGDTVLYWKNKSYYSYNTASGEETFLTEDKAYDSGIQHQSRGIITTGGKYVLFELVKATLSTDITYMYLYDYEDNSFIELNLTQE